MKRQIAEDIKAMVFVQYYRLGIKPDGSPNYHDKTAVWSYTMTREQYFSGRWNFLIEWRTALLVLQSPRNRIQLQYSFYDEKTGIDMGFNSTYAKYVSAKAQITKIKNKMQDARAVFKPSLFIQNIEDTEEWKKAVDKLASYECKLKEYENQLTEK